MKTNEIRKGLNDLSLVQYEILDVVDYLRGFDTLIYVFYKNMIENPNEDSWREDPNKYIELLRAPYRTVMENIKTTIDKLNDINDRMDRALLTIGNIEEEKESA